MEKIVKSNFVQQRQDLKTVVTEALDCVEVNSQFEQVVPDLSEEKRNKLKCMLFDPYVNIRMNAYTRSYNFILNKHENATSRKSLRHNLN